MSEDKCPCCGGSIFDMDTHLTCLKCQFSCAHKDLPRIAAAMDLALKVYLYHNKDGYLDEINDAEQRVVEVFRD